MFLNSLSGRFLILTIIFVMLAEILIFLPSVARFRQDFLQDRLERSQIASLALLAEDMLDVELEKELLDSAGVLNVVLQRDQRRELMLSSAIPQPIHTTFDLREPMAVELIRDAIVCLVDSEDRVIRVIGKPTGEAGLLIEVTMQTGGLRAAMLDYGLRVLVLSAMISVVTAFLLFWAVRRVLVLPIRSLVGHMQSYASAPEDARRIIMPDASVLELREAQDALQSMQTDLTGALRQKDRLAQLGSAVAKVSHDLRNILTTAQLFADRVEASEDPAVVRTVPKLINSISRAVSLCEGTLAFGKAEEAPPSLAMIQLDPIVDDVFSGEQLAAVDGTVEFINKVPAGLVLRADSEQLFRVLSNLTRNARQAIMVAGSAGSITIRGLETDEGWCIEVVDTGPGLPPKAQEHLFSPFSGSARKGGTGLGLAIASDLIKGHGGRIELASTGEVGTTFHIILPKLIMGAVAAQ